MSAEAQPELFSSQLHQPAECPRSPLRDWFEQRIGQPTDIQRQAWPVIARGEHALLLAPTGQGKSLAAWLPIVERTIGTPKPEKGLQALHIAPLKALARDMTHNLETLMQAASAVSGRAMRMELRCGDTPAGERRLQIRKSPSFLATTPETLFILLGSDSGRKWLRSVHTVVVDEIHALAQSKRGAHLMLSLERLQALTRRPLQRIGLSATARPRRTLAGFLCGTQACHIACESATQVPDVRIESLASPLGPFPHHGHWEQVHDRVAELACAKGTHGAGMLVFCATRARVEHTAAALAERLGTDRVGAHHGSLDRQHRESIEQRFRQGELSVIVSSASLELGLDLGKIGRVCQLGSIGSINLLCQRAGRSGHRPGARPVVHVFPLNLNQWLEAEALKAALQDVQIEPTQTVDCPLDVLAQQLIAMVASRPGQSACIDDLFALCRRAAPWRDLNRSAFDQLVQMLIQQPVARYRDQSCILSLGSDGNLMASEDAAHLALTNAGVIPEWFEYDVLNAEDDQLLGRLDEEFAFESSVGDVVQLGNRPFRIVRTLPGRLWVESVESDAAQVPFWFGDGPARSQTLSLYMLERIGTVASQSDAVNEWLATTKAVLGALPGPNQLVVERFPDPNGDRHLVIHSFAGARLNRAWGLALRKRFCRQFNFELQAAATDDGILISLGSTSDFEVDEIIRFVHSKSARTVLIQALLDTPLFVTRFRWCANHALSVLRFDRSGPVSAQLQRNRSENLIEQVFPDQLACLENLSGPRQIPEHPLVQQAINDCLQQHMDIDGLEKLLQRIESRQARVITADLDQPSALAEALIHAPPNSFLDPAAAEERRTRSFESRPGSPFGTSAPVKPGRSSGPARVTERPKFAVHQGTQALLDLLDDVGYLTRCEGESGITYHGQLIPGGWTAAFQALMAKREAFAISIDRNRCLWTSMVNLGALQCVLPSAQVKPWLSDSLMPKDFTELEQALMQLVRGRMRVFGGVDVGQVSNDLMCSYRRIEDLVERVQS